MPVTVSGRGVVGAPIVRVDEAGLYQFQPAHEYVDALRTRRRLTAASRQAGRDVDVLVLPTTPLRATPIGAPLVTVNGGPMAVGHSLLAFTLPFNMAGMPAVSVPLPWAGLPIGIQVVGVRVDEHGVLRVAADFALGA